MKPKSTQPVLKVMKLSDLTEAPYNPRKISDKALAGLAASIKRFGLTQPIVWNKKTKRIVSGHQRVKALDQLGEKEAAVMVVDWPELKEKQANLAHNNPAITGEFTSGIDALLAEISEADKDGFDELLFDEIIQAPEDLKELPGIDDVPEVKTGTTKANTGEIWELGEHRLMCASATDPKSIAALMAGGKAQCVFTDPPYGVSYKSQSGKFSNIKGDEKTGDTLIKELITPALKLAMSNSEESAAFYIWHASSTREDFAHAMKQVGLVEKQYLIWAKPSPVLGWGDYQWAHEP